MPVNGHTGFSLVGQEPVVTSAHTTQPSEAIGAAVFGVLAVLTCPIWFIGGPLGVVAVIGGRIAWRRGRGWTSQVGATATALGAAAALFAAFVAVFITPA